MTENIQTNFSNAYLQDNECRILFDESGNILRPQNSTIDFERIAGTKKSIYLNENNRFDGQEGYCCDGDWYFDYNIGARYGLNTETANANPTFSIDRKGGVINFSSGIADELVILEYVSDGMEAGGTTLLSPSTSFSKSTSTRTSTTPSSTPSWAYRSTS